MKARTYLLVSVVAALPSCGLYNEGLLDVDGDGDSDSVTTGGTAPVGGTGGSITGGAPSGGASAGGTESGGSDSGGTGGSTGGASVLVDDLEQGPTYTNPPFVGSWDVYIDTSANGGTWVQPLVDMVEADPDDAENLTFRVHATGFGAGSWGLGVYVYLNAPSTIASKDISSYSKLIIRARGSSSTARTLRVAIEDEASRTAPACPDPACVPHAPLGQKTLTVDTWKTYEFPLVSTRDPAFDPTKAYAIHFNMDPPDAADTIDFWIDDIAFE